MLWVNLIMDTFAAMALATEAPKEDIIKGKPYPKNDNIITPVMWRNILGQSFFQIIVLSILLFAGSYIFNVEIRRPDEHWTFENGFHNTMIFNTFIFMQVFNEINCRKIGEHDFNVFADFFNNSLFLFIITLTVVVQVLLVQYGGEAVRCTPLTFQQHMICVSIGFLSLIFGYLAKLVPLSYFKKFRLNEEPVQMTDEERLRAYRASFRKSRSLSRSYTMRLNQSGPLKVKPVGQHIAGTTTGRQAKKTERTFTNKKEMLSM